MGGNSGNIKHGGCGTLTYARWKSMIARCYQVNAENFKYYGGKGIRVCPEWRNFPGFLSGMGECPNETMTLDRIDNDLDYSVDNCRWVTQAVQNNNRSYCVPLTYDGITKNIVEWANDNDTGINITPNALAMRIRLGWTVERALTCPVKSRTAK